MSEKKLSRRLFLQGISLASAAAILAACAPKATEAPKAEEPTKETAEEKPTTPPAAEGAPIAFLCRTDIKGAYAADKAVEEWNKNFASQIKLDEPPQGDIVTKIQSAQAAGDLVWDGYSVMEMPWSTVEWVKRGIISPLDDFIAASKIPNADKVVPGIIPTIKESVSFEGKQYGIPGNVGSVALAWFWEPLRAAGYEKQPETWDEVYDASKKIKEKYPDLTPFSYAIITLCLHFSMIWGATDEPYDEEGIVDIRGEASLNALEWMRKMVEEELMPGTDADQFGNWLKGGIAIISSFDVAGTMAQQTFGMDKAETGINFFPTKDSTHAGTPFWINNSVLLNKAKNPQGMVDFFLWWFGPDNKTTGKQITEVAAKPCYTYTYEEFVKGKPEFEWEQKGIDLVAKSKWFPVNTTWGIVHPKTIPYLQKLLDVSQEFSRDIAATEMQACYDEIKDELSKQKF